MKKPTLITTDPKNIAHLLAAAARLSGADAPLYFGPERKSFLISGREAELIRLAEENTDEPPPVAEPTFTGGEHLVFEIENKTAVHNRTFPDGAALWSACSLADVEVSTHGEAETLSRRRSRWVWNFITRPSAPAGLAAESGSRLPQSMEASPLDSASLKQKLAFAAIKSWPECWCFISISHV